MSRQSLKAVRHAYAQELRVVAPVKNDALVEAFAQVPRERFCGPGPWTIRPGIGASYRTPDRDPAWLYHNVLVALDPKKGINNGQPSMWAYLLDHLNIKPGARVLQIGAGTGYYTAILASLVGAKGQVTAVEYDRNLTRAARANLKAWANVKVVQGDGASVDPGEVDVVIVFAGGTHPAPLWLDRLAAGGQLLMPLVTDTTNGFMLKVTRRKGIFAAEAVLHCSFMLASGFRDAREARDLAKAMPAFGAHLPKLRALHRGKNTVAARKKAFFTGRDFWLSLA